jgi:UDP-GlcNAc3NAcA epimerase
MFKIATIVGARPQFIKAAVVSRAFAAKSNVFKEIIIHTGQHYDENMSDIFFSELQIPKPAFHLGIGGGSHGKNTGRMLQAIEAVLMEAKPDAVLVYGDTDSTLAGALAAAKMHIPVAHVEAGLRSFNKRMPEEVNRILTDHVSTLLFAPTQVAVNNLRNEGISGQSVSRVGDVMYDAALFYQPRARQPEVLKGLNKFFLSTIHRAENTNDPHKLREIMAALQTLAQTTQVVLPLHPRTKSVLHKEGIDTIGIHIIDPVGYLEMVWLIEHCDLVLTDSGGLQKEAYFFKKQAVVLRTETEWVELLDAGWNKLAGFQKATILEATYSLLKTPKGNYDALYGDGHSGDAIVARLLEELKSA